MPRYTHRQKRVNAVVKGYKVSVRRWHANQAKRTRLQHRLRRRAGLHLEDNSDSSSVRSSASSSSDSSSESSFPSSSSSYGSDTDSSSTSVMGMDDDDMDMMPELADVEWWEDQGEDQDEDMDWDWWAERVGADIRYDDEDWEMNEGSGSGSSSSSDSDDEGGYYASSSGYSSGEDTPFRPSFPLRASRTAREAIETMYEHRYEMPRDNNPRPPAHLDYFLDVVKDRRPDLFREELRVTPRSFDSLVERLEDDAVFANDSSNEQMPVEHQIGIFLYRTGYHGNAAKVQKVAWWSGYSVGTVLLATRRVMTAILRRDFLDENMRWPTEEEKEEAKQWVEDHSVKQWRDGYLFVDGTLVPLYAKPFWYGESYYDRKSHYSLNVQLVCLPNLRIVDFSYGYVGSTHDSTAWQKTKIYAEHEDLLAEGEWIWGDSAYPIESWLVAPFKMPEARHPDKESFNTALSHLRIRNEHANALLKGRFGSLRGLRLNISDEKTHKFATYWIVCCVYLHNFFLECEQNEREEDGEMMDPADDPFVEEGRSSSSEDENAFSDDSNSEYRRRRGARAGLYEGKQFRLKKMRQLFREREKRHRQRQRNARAARRELLFDTDETDYDGDTDE
ncbi:unnamed protein product [Peniophora sp. CBMAI 1063]|nr:unnamed protein product [Peniophora sp. CBMAI 1063]